MKKVILIILLLIITIRIAYSQSPYEFKYQTVVRDADGNLVKDQNVAFKISILKGSIAGNAEYVETQTVKTNQFGLANLVVGNGTILTGRILYIDWANGTYYIKIEADKDGGTAFELLGTSQLLSVPYALYAQQSGTGGPTGPTGATGMTGVTGPTGADGAQNAWGITGNSGTDANTNFIGTKDYKDFVFKTNGLTRMTLSKDGKLGIGTTSPELMLDINGRMKLRGDMTNGTSGLWLNHAYNIFSSSDRAFIGLDGPDYVGFWGNNGIGWGLVMNTTDGRVGLGLDKNVAPYTTFHVNSHHRYGGYFTTDTAKTAYDDTKPVHVVHAEYKAASTYDSEVCGVYGKAVYQNSLGLRAGYGGLFEGGYTGVIGQAFPNDNALSSWYTGVNGQTVGSATSTNCGVNGHASGPVKNYAVYGFADNYTYSTGTSYGGYFGASGYGTSVNYGIYAKLNKYESATGYAAYFEGDVHYTGVLSGPSDRKLKENIEPEENMLEKVIQLKPSTFYYQSSGEAQKLNLPHAKQFGLIAQDVELVFPELVREEVNIISPDKNSKDNYSAEIRYKGINYLGLIPILTQAIKEQQNQIEELKKEVKELKTLMNKSK